MTETWWLALSTTLYVMYASDSWPMHGHHHSVANAVTNARYTYKTTRWRAAGRATIRSTDAIAYNCV